MLRRVRRGLAAVAIAAVVIAFFAPIFIGWILGRQLKDAFATHGLGQLSYDRVRYAFPYGVTLNNAHLNIPGSGHDPASWVDVTRLSLSLTQLPLHGGPVLIEMVDFENPTVHCTAAKSEAASTQPTTSTAASPRMLSSFFHLDQLVITNGQIEYDSAQQEPSATKITLSHINAKVSALKNSPGSYAVTLNINDQSAADLEATGSIDVDSLLINVDSLATKTTCDWKLINPQFPPRFQAIIDRYKLAGQARLTATGSASLSSPHQSKFAVTLHVANVSVSPDGYTHPITVAQTTMTLSQNTGPADFDLTMRDDLLGSLSAHGSIDSHTPILNVDRLTASTRIIPARQCEVLPTRLAESLMQGQASGILTLNGTARLPLKNPASGWYIATLNLTDGQYHPADWAGPITNANFAVVASNVPVPVADSNPARLPDEFSKDASHSRIWVNTLSASAGNQIFSLNDGQWSINTNSGSWTLDKLRGIADLGDGPGPLQASRTKLFIPFTASGNGTLEDSHPAFSIALHDASAILAPNHIHLDKINGLINTSGSGLATPMLSAQCANGEVKLLGNLDWNLQVKGPPIAVAYNGELHIAHLDLHEFSRQYYADPANSAKASGQLDFNTEGGGSILRNSPASGSNSAADRLKCQGDFDITNGDFLEIPILRDLMLATHHANGSTVGEAAATFQIDRSLIRLKHAGASSPVLGIQGGGTITFDQKVKMDFVVTPLADWAKDVKGAFIFGDIAGAVAHQFQDTVNRVQRNVYQFRIRGDLFDPDVNTVLLPFITDNVGQLFKKMAAGAPQGTLSQEMKKQEATPP